MDIVYFNEETYRGINEALVSWRGYNNFKAYQEEVGYEEELYEFYRLSPNVTNVPVEIWFDDSQSYIRNNHPLWIYFRNGNPTETLEFIPVSVSNNPQILIQNPKIKISSNVIVRIKQFVQRFKKELILVANDKIKNYEFERFVKKTIKGLLESIICEMAILKSSDTGLKTDLWIDTGVMKQHGPRIKFKSSNEQKRSVDFSTMTISDNPEIYHLPKNTSLSNKDIEKIKNFVKYNKDKLLQLDKGEINYADGFVPYMIKVGSNGGPIYPSTLLEPLLEPKDIEHPENKDVNQMVLNYYKQVNKDKNKKKNSNDTIHNIQ